MGDFSDNRCCTSGDVVDVDVYGIAIVGSLFKMEEKSGWSVIGLNPREEGGSADAMYL